MHIQSSFYHRVPMPTEEQCSNEYLMRLANEHVPNIRTPSQTIQSARIAYLGHILPHEESLESQIIFNSTHAYRQISHRRPGAPRTHWAELTMAETYLRLQHQHAYSRPPRTYEVDHPFYKFLQRPFTVEAPGFSVYSFFPSSERAADR